MFTANPSLHFTACLPQFPLATKIVVKNLPYSLAEKRLQSEFSRFGQIAEVKLVKDEQTKKSKGYAFIQYTARDDALLALETMDHKNLDGRVIYVELAKPGRDVSCRIPIASGPPPPEKAASPQEGLINTPEER